LEPIEEIKPEGITSLTYFVSGVIILNMHAKRRIFLINKRFQFKYALFTAAWVMILTMFYPMLIYQIFNYLIEYLSLDPMAAPFKDLQGTRDRIIFLLVFLHLLFIGIAGLISIFVSHRIAGPIYKMQKHMGEIKSGLWPSPVRFRKYDHFPELATSFNEMILTIKGRDEVKTKQIKDAILLIEEAKSGASSPKLDKALEILKQASH
jgi:methyl-accepting chemotaxis protein